MKRNREKVQGWIGLSEGGYVNHPRDPGGATDRGITQATYNAYLKRRGLPQRSVRGISKEVAEEIIYEQYMRPIWFDELPSGLDYCLADYGVNSGPSRAIKAIQRIVGTTPDGVMGNKTMAAIKSRDRETLIKSVCAERMRFLRGLKTFSTFGRGWTTRVVGMNDGFQEDDIGVLDRSIMLARSESVIPDPSKTGGWKAVASDVSAKTVISDMFKDPVSAVPAVSAVAPLMSGTGPVQIAMAVVIVLVAGFIIYGRIKKEKAND